MCYLPNGYTSYYYGGELIMTINYIELCLIWKAPYFNSFKKLLFCLLFMRLTLPFYLICYQNFREKKCFCLVLLLGSFTSVVLNTTFYILLVNHNHLLFWFSGYDGPINEWEDYPRFVNPDGVEMAPPVCFSFICMHTIYRWFNVFTFFSCQYMILIVIVIVFFFFQNFWYTSEAHRLISPLLFHILRHF